MMDPRGERELEWSAADLRDLAQHALAAKLGREPERDPRQSEPRHPARRERERAVEVEDVTIGDLLAAEAPSREHLELAKRFVKQELDDGSDALPRDVSKALYAAIVAKARLAGHGAISRLSEREFARLARWCLAQTWVGEAIKDVLRRAVQDCQQGKACR
jgi:hypothetical protein